MSPPSVDVSDVILAFQADDTSENVAETAGSSDISEDKNNTAEKAQNFPCPICDFVSSWANGLQIHMTKKHANIEQVDGNDTVLEDEDDKYTETEHYWKTGRLGTIYQTFLDVNKIIDSSNLQGESKKLEKEKALDSRKFGFGSNFQNVPPWNKKL